MAIHVVLLSWIVRTMMLFYTGSSHTFMMVCRKLAGLPASFDMKSEET